METTVKSRKKNYSDRESDEMENEKELSSVMEETTEEEIESSEDEVEENLENYLLKIWKSLSPPTKEADIKGKWYAIIYEQGKKKYLYIGRVLQRFSIDENGVINFLQIDCLKQHLGSGNILESIPAYLPRDVYMCPVHDIIDRPLKVIPVKNHKWHVVAYEKIKKRYQEMIKIDGQLLYLTLENQSWISFMSFTRNLR